MKKVFTLLSLFISFSVFSQSTTVVISQVYGGGGSASATYQADYVELHNISGASQNIGGYKIMYGSSTGNLGSVGTNIFTFPAGVTIPVGGYLLVANTTLTGLAPLPVSPDQTFTLSMSGTAGKIAFGTAAMVANVNYAGQPAGSVIDFVGYGTANESETSPTPALSITTAALRNSNGCAETNNNLNDFTVASPAPRNSASSAVPCGATPTLSASASSLTFNSPSPGSPSPSQSFNLSGSNLTPASGNITITPTTHYEISFDNTTFFTTAQTVAYSGGALASTPVYARLAASAPAGVTNGTITCSGGGAPNAVINVSGGVTQNYYNTKANLGLTNVGTWSTTTDGTGPSPANFSSGFQVFNIINQTNANYTGVWDVNFTGSKVVVGDGTAPITLTIPNGTDSITSGTRIDVLNNGTLVMQNNRRPFLNSLAVGSTVDFAQTGVTSADTIKVPTISYYNLKFTGGLKYFSSGTVTIRGNFTADGVVSINGAPSPFTTVNSLGNITFQNAAAFEPNPSGDNGRITWKMNGPGPTQSINGTGHTLLLFRLQRDSTATCNINVSSNTNITLGNAAGGGLTLTPVGATLSYGTGIMSLIGAATGTNTALGKITAAGTSMVFAKTAGTTANMGTLKFNAGSVLGNVTMNVDAAIARDSVTFANDVSMTGVLTLTKGKIVVSAGATLSLNSTATVTTSGNGASFVDGALRRTGTTAFTFPSGKGNKYAPVDFSGYTGGDTYTVQYFNSFYGNSTIDPATATLYPQYNISLFEYWNITQAVPGTVDLVFYYTDAASAINQPLQVRMAHFDGTDWNDIGGVAGPFNAPAAGYVTVTGVSQFSPFTFAGTVPGVVPVKLSSFNVQKRNSTVEITWTTEQEVGTKEFIVERSSDGRNWTPITTVAAAVFSSVKRYYATTDFLPLNGVNFYRLKMVDNHAGYDYSPTKSVLFSRAFNIIVAPNPANGIITVYLPELIQSDIRLYNSNGQMVRSVKANEQTVRVGINGLAKGVYILTVTGNGIFDNRKILIN